MVQIDAGNNGFRVNDHVLEFPINADQLKGILGENRLTNTKYNQIYTWDDMGIMAFSKDGKSVESLLICTVSKTYKFYPKQLFNGIINFNGEEAISFYNNNKDKRIKLFKGDKSGAIIMGDVSFWFDKEENVIEAIEIKSYSAPEVSEKPALLPVDERYQYLKPLWEEWIEEINKVIPEDNVYYNLTNGITQSDIELHSKLDKGIAIPDELINFYKIQNVDYDAVTSVFSFSANGWKYDLIPFEDISQEWLAIQGLQSEDEAETISEASEKLKTDNYANPKWIPFAAGRNGDYLLYDTDPSSKGNYGQIVELQNESWQRNVVTDSLTGLMQNEINLLKSGQLQKYDFILGKK